MQNTPGARPLPPPRGTAAPVFTEDQLEAFDRAYTAAKTSGALDRAQAAAAAQLDLSHNRSARLA